MSSPGMGKAKKNPARARRVARKEKKATQAKVATKSQGKGKGTGKSKSKVTEIIESDNSKHVDEWCPNSNTSAQQPNLSQVNTIGCADEETLDIFAGRQKETSVLGVLGRSVLFSSD